jgi:hypothetical protein
MMLTLDRLIDQAHRIRALVGNGEARMELRSISVADRRVALVASTPQPGFYTLHEFRGDIAGAAEGGVTQATCSLHDFVLLGGRCLECAPAADDATIYSESLVSSHPERRGEPFVRIAMGQSVMQATPEQARRVAFDLLEVADGAETDSLLVAFLQRSGCGFEGAVAALRDFRGLREARKIARTDQGVTKV